MPNSETRRVPASNADLPGDDCPEAKQASKPPDAAQTGQVGTEQCPPVSFEIALAELEAIVARMESGELALEQSLSEYKRGTVLLQYCQSALKDAQQQVKVLEAGVLKDFSGADDNG
jgi:exodeoxyribonuclease VII small subunit